MPTFALQGRLQPRFAKYLLEADPLRVRVIWSQTREGDEHMLESDPPSLALWLEVEAEIDDEPILDPVPFSASAPFLTNKESALLWLQLRVFAPGYEASGDTRLEWEDDPPGTVY